MDTIDRLSDGLRPSVKKRYLRLVTLVCDSRERLAEPKIGLGIDSPLPLPQKVRRDQVRIDAHTKPLEINQSYHALYVAGWAPAPETG